AQGVIETVTARDELVAQPAHVGQLIRTLLDAHVEVDPAADRRSVGNVLVDGAVGEPERRVQYCRCPEDVRPTEMGVRAQQTAQRTARDRGEFPSRQRREA